MFNCSIVEQVWRNLENRELICGLKLIRCFRLLDTFDKERLADTLAKASPVLAEIDFFLKDAPVMSKVPSSRCSYSLVDSKGITISNYAPMSCRNTNSPTRSSQRCFGSLKRAI